MTDNFDRHSQQKPIAIWLFICAATIFAMIVLGGVTRLTHSGLSMVDWKPVVGIIPPLNEAAWQAEFEKYQAFPEFQKINFNMSLPEFKKIFYFEYAHRVLGRLIGVLFLVPFLFFYFTRRVEKSLTPKLIIIFILGGLQGLLGWYMVKSGLVNEPHVSQYRLTAHLGFAVVIYAYILWVAFELLYPAKPAATALSNKSYSLSIALTALIFILILSGGFVAGTRAGFAYNTFPLMAGAIIPDGLFNLSPIWRNFFDNIITVQFNHRILAYIAVIISAILSFRILSNKPPKPIQYATYALISALLLQLSLGIATLLLVVPVSLGAMHQAGAIVLFTAALYLTFRLKNPE